MASGYLALVLHAHLPFVRHPEHERFLEEEWLFEAITETYVPLLRMMQRLQADAVAFKLSMSLTPTLCAMLQDSLLRDRYVQHLDDLIDLMQRECDRTRKDPELAELAQFYCELFVETRRFFTEEWRCDLIAAFKYFQTTGALEIIASAATHAVLPLHSRETQRAQVLIGRDIYRELFGIDPNGFWLPECAYAPGVDRTLQKANIRWFVVDAHGLMFADPRPRRAIYAPCFTPAGPAAFARDRDSSRQVWSATEGYPGDPSYREFYRDIGWDLPLEHLGPVARGVRKFTGVKYYRITGGNTDKQLYDRSAAEEAAARHASHFLERRRWQLGELADLDRDPILVAPFDAELFGHWWFEGPVFLESLMRNVAMQSEMRLTTPGEYLAAHSTQQTVQPAASSWGENGHLEVWLHPSNTWIYPRLHANARKMTDLARSSARQRTLSELEERVLRQLGRELMLAQASDWAFLIKNGTAKEYATRRTVEHLDRFEQLYDRVIHNAIDGAVLHDCEWRDNLFPNINWRYFA
jgi:1,4-alpha-glucan branching enzyme